MSLRAMPAALLTAMLAAQTDKTVLYFLTVTYGATYSSTLYLVNNTVAVTRGGHSHLPFAFAPILPPSKDGEIGKAQLVIDAVDQSIITIIRQMDNRAHVNMCVAMADTPDATPELNLGTFEWSNIVYNNLTVSGELSYVDALSYDVPALGFTPRQVPGIF